MIKSELARAFRRHRRLCKRQIARLKCARDEELNAELKQKRDELVKFYEWGLSLEPTEVNLRLLVAYLDDKATLTM